MNGKTTLLVVILAGLAGLWVWKGDEWGPRIGLGPAHPEPPPAQAVRILDSFTPADVTRIEIGSGSGDPLVIERADSAAEWKLPGNWPARKAEVQQLVEVVGKLRSRFHAIPLVEGADLAAFGLAPSQNSLVVTLTARGQSHTLLFGDPEPAAGETAFTRPAYVRVDGLPEVLKLGPDVMPVLRRPAEVYRRRALFPDIERVKLANVPTAVAMPGENTERISVSRPGPRVFNFRLLPAERDFTLVRRGKLPEPAATTRGGEPTINPDRVADAWELVLPLHTRDGFPYRDNAEPGRLRAALAAVADLWVDHFVTVDPARLTLQVPIPFEPPLAQAVRLYPGGAFLDPVPFDVRNGLAKAEEAVSVKRKGADPVTVRFGAVARVVEREDRPAPPAPGLPPEEPKKVRTEYRYARVDGNPLVFIVAGDKLSDLFASVGELVDPRVARFSPDEVRQVTIRPADGPEVKLTFEPGDPNATEPGKREDRWFLERQPNRLPADASRVNDLLTRLAGLSAAGFDRIRYPDSTPTERTQIILVARERRPRGEPDAPTRTFTLQIGDPDPVKQLLPVAVAGARRVTLVDNRAGTDDPDSWIASWLFPNTVADLFNRPAVAYRGRELFDTTDPLRRVVLLGKFVLTDDNGWKLTEPFLSEADPGRAAQLATSLLSLRATEYLVENPTADQLKAFGLDSPANILQLTSRDGRVYTLELGARRPGLSEVFARLDKGSVFGLADTAVEQLTTGAVGLLPLQVWSTPPEKITALEMTRYGDEAKNSFSLTRDGTNWKLTGPFTAPVSFLSVQPKLTTLGNLTAVKYQALSATNPAEFGLDQPLATLKFSFLNKNPDGTEAPVTRTLTIGGPTPEGNRFARLDGPVFVVPAAFVVAVQTSPLDLLDRTLLFLDRNRIVKVQVATAKPEESFSLTKNEQGQWAAEGTGFPIDRERIDQLLATTPVRAERIAAYGDGVKWAEFGLDKPEATVTITLAGDKPQTHTIALGKSAPDGGRFARVDNGPAVAVLAPAAATALARKKFDYADRTLLTFDPASITGLTRQQGTDELELVPGAAVGWDIVKPAKQKGDAELVDELTATLGKLRAERVVGYGPKADVFKQYGLEPPAAVLTLTVGDKAEQKKLRLGNPVDPAKPDGERYAAVESAHPEAIVGVLPAALTSKLLAPPVAFRDRTLARFVDADRAVLERGDRKITFSKVGGTWKVTEPLATAAESAALDNLIGEFGRLRADTWVAEKGKDLKPFGLDKPEAKWTLFDGDRTVLVLSVSRPKPDGRAHVATDKGELIGLLDAPLTGRVLAEYRQRRPWDVDAVQIDSVGIAAGGSKFTLEKAGATWIDPARPTDPIDGRAVNELLGTLAALRVERYAADTGADPKLFGLEKPEVTLTVRLPTGDRVLEIGGVVGGTDGKQRYARIVDGNRSDVFVLSAADTDRLTRDRSLYVMKK